MGRSGGGGGFSSGGSHSFSGSSSHGSSHSHSSRSSLSGRASHVSHSSSSHSGSYHSRPSSHVGPRPVYHTPPRHVYGGYGYGGYGAPRRSRVGCLGTVVTWVFVMVLVFVILGMIGSVISSSGGGRFPASTTQRERVETKNAYINDCVHDEIGWISNPSKVSKGLQDFYKKTGCQPYIILREYDASMSTVSARESWTQNYYDTTFANNQNVLLYVYFCDRDDEGEGDSCLWMGTEASVVMDSEAVEIFWAYLDYDWDAWDVNDNDGMYVDVFTRTADRIMTVTTTDKDIGNTLLKGFFIVIGLGVVAIVLKMVFTRRKEKAQETIDILNAPLGQTMEKTEADNLADRYNGGATSPENRGGGRTY